MTLQMADLPSAASVWCLCLSADSADEGEPVGELQAVAGEAFPDLVDPALKFGVGEVGEQGHVPVADHGQVPVPLEGERVVLIAQLGIQTGAGEHCGDVRGVGLEALEALQRGGEEVERELAMPCGRPSRRSFGYHPYYGFWVIEDRQIGSLQKAATAEELDAQLSSAPGAGQ